MVEGNRSKHTFQNGIDFAYKSKRGGGACDRKGLGVLALSAFLTRLERGTRKRSLRV